MSLHHSEETHTALLSRVEAATGRDIKVWLQTVENGPTFTRLEERVRWLQDEHGLSHGHATAVAHEYDKARAARRVG